MSSLRGARCPFVFNRSDADDSETRKITFKKAIDPNDPNGIKLVHSAFVLTSSDVESILKHEAQFARLQNSLSLDTLAKRRAVCKATLGDNLRTAWLQAITEPPLSYDYDQMGLLELRNARD